MKKPTPIFTSLNPSYQFECNKMKVHFIDYRIGKKEDIVIKMEYKDTDGNTKVHHLVVGLYIHTENENVIIFNPPVEFDFGNSKGMITMELVSLKTFDIAICFDSEP